MVKKGSTFIVDIGVSTRPMEGETACGDVAVLEAWPRGALVAAIDALGHGPEAEQVAQLAESILRKEPQGSPAALLERCHAALRDTRGAAISLASFSSRDHTLTWLGVGNVEGFLFRANSAASPRRESIVLRGGVVGYQLPPLRPVSHPILRGDTLVLVSDGVSDRFADRWPHWEAPQQLADRILEENGKKTDDALVVVARYHGGRP
jgi:serine phosphatase RsbU (regulator of sigma subunit)